MRTNRAIPIIALLAACQGETVTKTITNTNTNTVTVPNNNTITNTVTVPNTITVSNPQLEPGHFDEVLVETQRVQDNGSGVATQVGLNQAGEDHMHVSELIYRPATANNVAQMMYCAYTFGVLDATNPASMTFQAQGFRHAKTTGTKEPGCIHLNADDSRRDVIYTTHHGGITDGLGFLSGWNLHTVNDVTDANLDGIPDFPTKVTIAPTEIPKLTEAGVAYEGLDNEGGFIYVTEHDGGLGVYTYDDVLSVFTKVGGYTNLINSWDVMATGGIAYVADGIGGLVTLDISNPAKPTYLGRVVFDGEARDIAKNGDTLYVAAESGGVAVIDVADPTNPQLVYTIPTISAIAISWDSDNLFVGAWEDARVYDTSVDPHVPTILGVARQECDKEYSVETVDESRPNIVDRVLGISGVGDFMFDGTWHIPYLFQLYPDRKAPYIVLPEELEQLTFPGDLLLGQSATHDIEIRNDGTADLTIYDIWTDSPAFTPSSTEMLIHPGDTATLTLTFSPTIGMDLAPPETADTGAPFSAQETTLIHFVSDDPQQPVRLGYLVGNPDGIGVGDTFPETQALLNDGTSWSFTNDALGSVTLVAYFATF